MKFSEWMLKRGKDHPQTPGFIEPLDPVGRCANDIRSQWGSEVTDRLMEEYEEARDKERDEGRAKLAAYHQGIPMKDQGEQ